MPAPKGNKFWKLVKHLWMGCNSPAYYLINAVRYENVLTKDVLIALKKHPGSRYLKIDCDICGGNKYIVTEEGDATSNKIGILGEV